jgi:hypothetical protein
MFNSNQLQECAEVTARKADSCSCASCKGKYVDPHLASGKTCKWQSQHIRFMKENGLNREAVAVMFARIEAGTPRTRHLLACVLELNKLLRQKGEKLITIVNDSQSIYRCTMSRKRHLPVITPGGHLYQVESHRHLRPEEGMLFMGFPLSSLDLGPLRANQIASLAGNAMHIRMVGVAWLIALGLIDKNKFSSIVAKSQGAKRKTKLVGASVQQIDMLP